MSIAIFSVLGIVVGATLQYLFTRFLEERKHKRLLQTEAYVDFLRSVADGAHLHAGVNEAEVHARIADARARIALYGSPDVVRLLAEFDRTGNAIITKEQREAFVRLIKVMRGDDQVESDVLEVVLIGASERRPS